MLKKHFHKICKVDNIEESLIFQSEGKIGEQVKVQ